MPEQVENVAAKVESQYQRVHAWYESFDDHWRRHTNRRTIIIAILFGITFAAFYLFAVRPPDRFPAGQLVTVPEGESVKDVGQTLYEDGVIRSPLLFRVVVTVLHQDRTLHAGDYLFKEPLNVFLIAQRVALGAFGLEPLRVRVPEGATVKQMASLFSTVLPRFNVNTFIAKAQPDEGYLFPDTYFFLPNATEDTVVETMRQDFDTHVASITPELASSTHSLADIVTMASIIEREANDYKDRQMIAGVLWRRISLGMPLQADAAFFYILAPGQQITKSVLATSSPYNTYLNKGLPPSPIGSPSLSSIEAATDPIDEGYLYYLADSNGVTHYCKTYACQQANEREYLGI